MFAGLDLPPKKLNLPCWNIYQVQMSADKYIKNSNGHFVCPHCSKVEEKQNTMYYHIKSVHEQDFPFECALCTEEKPRFLQRCSWLHHLATHHPDSPHPSATERNPYAGVSFACPSTGCEHTSHTKANTIIHYARTHCKDWIPAYTKGTNCTGCKKSFASSSAYLYHASSCLRSTATENHITMLSRIK